MELFGSFGMSFFVILVLCMVGIVLLSAYVNWRKENKFKSKVPPIVKRVNNTRLETTYVAIDKAIDLPELGYTSLVGAGNTFVSFTKGILIMSKGCTTISHEITKEDAKKLSKVLLNYSKEDSQ